MNPSRISELTKSSAAMVIVISQTAMPAAQDGGSGD